MKTFKVKAWGRKRGAGGLMQWVEAVVKAEDESAAIIAAYDHIEHLSRIAGE